MEISLNSPWIEGWLRFTKNKAAVGSLVFLLVLTMFALLAPVLAPYSFEEQDVSSTLQTPSYSHWMGTDRLGRDLFSRILYGARVSLSVGFFTAFIALLIGTAYGAISGYRGGKTDQLMMRGVDVVFSLPDLKK